PPHRITETRLHSGARVTVPRLLHRTTSTTQEQHSLSILIHDAQIAAMDTRTGSEPFTGSIRVSGSEIVEIGSELRPQPGERVIDGRDRLVTPGFVNAHTHSWETLYKGRYDNLPLELWMLYAYPILGADPLTPELIR